MKTKLAHVWPLVGGLPGFNAAHEPVTLETYQRGLMPLEAALRHESKGNLVLMAGKTPAELYALQDKPRTYQTATVVAEEEPPRKRRGRPPGKGSSRYKRRDMIAEDPK